MNLPVILDVAIGLVFIYLILSLLASEIQELLTTLLQWRATHLKQSIQTLLTGGELGPEDQKVTQILSNLYNNPLLKGINHESKEGWEGLFRKFTWWIADGYAKMMAMMGKEKKILGTDRSAPSYIPAETFANTLFDLLDINNLSHKLTSLNLSRLIENEIYLPINDFIHDPYAQIHFNNRNYLTEELRILNSNNLAKINDDFRYQKCTIEIAIRKLNTELELFIENCKRHFENSDLDRPEAEAQFINKLSALKTNLFYNSEEILWRLKPTLNQMIDIADTTSQFYQSIKADLGDKNSPIYQTFQEIENHIDKKFKTLPSSLRDTLTALAKKTELKVQKAELQMNHFQTEVESWFDKSMDRAGGVYKRNAKGVAFMIGFAIAFLANADTLHIISRLSKDSALRNTIAQNAGQVISNNPKETKDLTTLKKQTEKVLKEIPFPMGWESDNLEQQINWRWDSQKSFPFQKIGKMLVGWIISGAAISMGASFWFDILGKLINVRNTGSRPKSKSQNEETES